MHLNLPEHFLRQIEAELASKDTAKAGMAQAISEALQGSTGARFTLRRTMALADNGLDLRRAAAAAILCQDMETASLIFTRLMNCRCEAEVRLALPDRPHYSVESMLCHATSASRIIFDLHPGIASSRHVLHEMHLFTAILPLFGAFCAARTGQLGTSLFHGNARPNIPCLAYRSARPDIGLLPDPGFTLSNGYEAPRRILAKESVPWAKRHMLAFWRGRDNTALEHAARAANEAQATALCDAAALTGAPPTPEMMQRYAYLIESEDGAPGSPGLFPKLLTGSAVLQVEKPNPIRFWLHARLKPWEHYVPVKPDFSDLAQQIRWLQRNEREAQQIGQNGQRVAEAATYDAELTDAAKTIAQHLKP